MARRDDRKKKKVNVKPRREVPLQTNAFDALSGLNSLELAPSPEPEDKPKPKPRRDSQTPTSVSAKAVTTKSGEVKGVAKIKKAAPTPKAELKEPPAEPNSSGRVILRREKKGRGGKTVVIISGFRELENYNAVEVGNLAKKLRNALACGGSFDRNEIVIQGDRPKEIANLLRHLGFRVDGVTS